MVAEYGPESRLVDIKRLVVGRNDLKASIKFTHAKDSLSKSVSWKSKAKKRWDVEFNLDATGLFSDDLIDRDRSSKKSNNVKSTKDSKKSVTDGLSLKSIRSGTGLIRVTKGTVRDFSFEELKADIEIDPEVITSKNIQMKKNRGGVASNVTYYRTDNSPLLFKSTSVVSGIDLKQFVDELGSKQSRL